MPNSPASREIVRRTLRFENPPRMARNLLPPWGTDFAWAPPQRPIDARPHARGRSRDEWGAVWESFGASSLGEVKEYPLADWAMRDTLAIPDVHDPSRYANFADLRRTHGDQYILVPVGSLYERAHFLRGLENVWADIREEPDRLGELIDLLADQACAIARRAAEADADGIILTDDWGLQDRLMIDPADWRSIWKPRYARVMSEAKKHGMDVFMHSCGHITAILDDLVEIGLDAIDMDQQQNMGLETLSRWRGRLTFLSPVDIQATMATGDTAAIRAYARQMVKALGGDRGGFIFKFYSDPAGAGHTPEAIEAMCGEFSAINREYAVQRGADAQW